MEFTFKLSTTQAICLLAGVQLFVDITLDTPNTAISHENMEDTRGSIIEQIKEQATHEEITLIKLSCITALATMANLIKRE